jgi:hypothetical protein
MFRPLRVVIRSRRSGHIQSSALFIPIRLKGAINKPMNWRNRTALALPLIAIGLHGCGGGFPAVTPPPPPPPGTRLSVNPQSITVAAGSATTFTGVFAPTAPTGGFLTWSITPVDGGTITGAGVLTASATAGTYAVQASWTPAISIKAAILKGTANVTLLPVPQLDSVISPELVQGSGANQTAEAIQNGAVVGQGIPSVLAVDSSGQIEALSSFTVPAACAGSATVCQ